MKRLAMVAVLGVAMVVLGGVVDLNAAQKTPTIKEIMKTVNGKGGLCGSLGGLLKAKEPKWDEIQAKAKELTPLAKAMSKNTPPKGDADSWKKLTADYAAAAEKLEKAAADKDLKAAQEAHKGLTGCAGCHKAHK